MKRMILTGLILMSVLMVWAPAATAPATTPSTPAPVATAEPHWHTMDFMDAFHHPFDGLEMGLDMRLRDEYSHNTTSLSDQYGDTGSIAAYKKIKNGNWNEENSQRYRVRWNTIWTLAPDVTFNTRLVWEFWTFNTERSNNYSTCDQNTDLREMIFDRMNLTFKNAFDAPMTLVVGRQDIMLGTGWLVGDGTPGDGSRTMFFDAVRATIDLRDKTQLDLIGIANSDDERGWMTPINHRDYIHLTQKQDEKGFIAYLTDKSIENTTLEGYYIYKKDEPSTWAKHSESWWTTSYNNTFNDEIHTFGGRIAQNLDKNWSYSVEVAKQFGTKAEESMRGLGTNNKLNYAFNDEWKNELRLTQEYLSGNDPGTGKANEAFDPLWGEYPQAQRGGDLITNLYSSETAKGEVTNLHRVGVGHTFKPTKEWTFATDYNLLWADQNTLAGTGGTNSGIQFNNDGNFRGQLFSWLATYSCCKSFKTYFMLDYFVPGSYYDQATRDHAVFARVNLEWTF